MKFRRSTLNDASVELTPLIDIVFLLLIFFVVTTTFEQKSDLEINLPTTGGDSLAKLGSSVTLKINRNGGYSVNGKKLGDQALETLKMGLIEELDMQQDISLTIEADAEVTHQSVVTGLDAAAQLGIKKVRILTIHNDMVDG